MKRFVSLLLCFLLVNALCACSKQDAPKTDSPTQESTVTSTPLSDGKTLKLLAITSSFGLNTTQFLYDISVAEGATDVVVARLYVGGCTLQQHVDYLTNSKNVYTYTKNNSGIWQTTEAVNMLYGIQDEDWDIIFIQQSAAGSAQVDTYGNYVDQIIAYVNEHKTNPNAKFIWNMTWAYQKDSTQDVFLSIFGGSQQAMYLSLVNAVQQKIVPRTDIAAIIPSGTAIQNARTSYFGDHLTKDTYHLNDLGQVISGYTLYATLIGKPLAQINLSTGSTDQFPKPLDLSAKDKEVIMEAVNAAMQRPFEVTSSTFPTP